MIIIIIIIISVRWAASSGRGGRAIPSRPSPGNPTVFSATIYGGNPGGVTGETRGSRPGVPLNKLIGNGTSGSVGRAGGPGVRVGGFAGGILAAGFS